MDVVLRLFVLDMARIKSAFRGRMAFVTLGEDHVLANCVGRHSRHGARALSFPLRAFAYFLFLLALAI
jgi:hypothetical protein